MKLTVIGLGKMGTTMIEGIIDSGLFTPEQITGCDIKVKEREKNPDYRDIKTCNQNRKGARDADIILLAVKPQVIDQVLEEIQEVVSGQLIISIAAGITLAHLQGFLASDSRLARVMPNTPALIGEGVSAVSYNENITAADKKQVENILAGVGEVIRVEEKLMDAVTGLSGSGPAYCYLMIEALADGGVLAGLDREKSLQLAAKTMMGAARMVLTTDKHPARLKDMVTSPAGTTITGIEELETSGVRGALIRAVKKASRRSAELNESG